MRRALSLPAPAAPRFEEFDFFAAAFFVAVVLLPAASSKTRKKLRRVAVVDGRDFTRGESAFHQTLAHIRRGAIREISAEHDLGNRHETL